MSSNTPALLSPGTNDDARWQAGTGETETSNGASIAHTGGTCLDKVDAERKAFATMQAKAALARAGLHKIEAGYLLTRWGLVRELPTLRAVGELLDRMTRPA